MKYTISEQKALKKLRIPDFRHMTKEKIVKFTSMLPKMDPEVAKAALEQFPEFKDMTTDIMHTFKEAIDAGFKSNDHSQDAFYASCNSIIASLQDELKIPDLSSDERSRIEDKLIEIARMIGEKDTENKKFILKVLAILGTFGLGAILAAASILGANSQITTTDDIDDDDEDYNNDEEDEDEELYA